MSRSPQNRRMSRRKRGFTLFELIASMAAASVLMVGLSSALYIAVQGVDVSASPQTSMLEALTLLSDMQADLQYATAITEQEGESITITIPDRDDADTMPDTVRYAWTAMGAPLTRQYNGGDVVELAASVHDLKFTYFSSGSVLQYVTTGSVLQYVTIKLEIIEDVFVYSSIPLPNQP